MLAGATALAVSWTGPVAAHTELEYSQPADGEIVGEPISQISLTFGRQVDPLPDSLTAFDELGFGHKPDAVDSTDGQTWLIGFETPLTGGTFEVHWRMVAADGHIIDGAFTFTVAAAEAETEPTIVQPSDSDEFRESGTPSEPPEEEAHKSDNTSTATAVASNAIGDEGTKTTPPKASTTHGDEPSGATTHSDPPQIAAPPEHDDDGHDASSFSRPRNSAITGSQRIAEITRILIFVATLGIVGGLAFAAVVVRDDQNDSDRARKFVGVGGVVLAAGATIAFLNRAVVIEREWSAFWSNDALSDVVSTYFGLTAGLRFLGGLVLAVASFRASAHPPGVRTVVAALCGGGLVIASFAFDGHTVTEGPRWLHVVASVTHVGAAAVWGGGVALLVDLLWRRHRRGADVIRPLMRFSRMAATALVLAGATGTVMAILVLDRFADLWSTPWGRLLLAKIALVGAAAAIGGHNRWVLIPAAEENERDSVHQRLRRAAFVEAVALLAVAVITAFLVAASTA